MFISYIIAYQYLAFRFNLLLITLEKYNKLHNETEEMINF